jgi:hypothetical protein
MQVAGQQSHESVRQYGSRLQLDAAVLDPLMSTSEIKSLFSQGLLDPVRSLVAANQPGNELEEYTPLSVLVGRAELLETGTRLPSPFHPPSRVSARAPLHRPTVLAAPAVIEYGNASRNRPLKYLPFPLETQRSRQRNGPALCATGRYTAGLSAPGCLEYQRLTSKTRLYGFATLWSVSAPALFVDDPLPLLPATMVLVLLTLSVINLVLRGSYMLLLHRPCCLILPLIVGMGDRSRKTGRRLPSSNVGGGDAGPKRPSGQGRLLNSLRRDDGGLVRTSCYIGRVPGREAHQNDAIWVGQLFWV